MKRTIVFCIILIFSIKISLSQIGGHYTYQFLELNNSAVAAALGGKVIANPTSLQLIYYNPALLDSTKHKNLSISYKNYFAGINLGDFTYAIKLKHYGNLAFGVHYINYGKFDHYDEQQTYLGQFSASEIAPYLTYSYAFDSVLTFGLNLKPVFSALQNYRSFGYAIDIGLLIHASKNSYFAVAARNIGKQVKAYSSQIEPLPFNLTAGFTGKFEHSPFRFNFTLDYLNYWKFRYISPIDNFSTTTTDTTSGLWTKINNITDEILRHAHLGLELILNPKFRFMLGYNFRRVRELNLPTINTFSGISAGFLFQTSKIDISYAYERYLTSAVHTFGLGLHFDKFIFRHAKQPQD